MFEDSPEAFISRWQRYAADAELFPHREGSPLIECRAGGAIVQLFERTGPYLSRPGQQRTIIHPVTSELIKLERGSATTHLAATGISRLEAVGTVLATEDRIVVVDAGAPLVVGVLEPQSLDLQVGDLVSFESAAPVHGFLVASPSPFLGHPRRDRHDDHI